ncbi:unnamed protein product, partial [Didymodactylos carnosus]
MHVIPKPSQKTGECYKHLEFRYSFSAVELIMAKQRTYSERILNGIARSIYHKYLYSKQEVCITSYFIKTTVLWLCETENIDAINEQNYDLLTK